MKQPDRQFEVPSGANRTVVVHGGNRDRYQIPLALHEGRILKAFVTDIYSRHIPRRYAPALDGARILTPALAAACAVLARAGLASKRRKDLALSRAARTEAAGDPVLATTYYASEAFREGPDRPRRRGLFLLQAEPHSLRAILTEEIERTPSAARSLRGEYELALPAAELEVIAGEPELATHWIATSSFSAETYAARGIPREQIAVVPYGVDPATFPERETPPTGPFRAAYAGSVIQRKGISYLLEACRRAGVGLTLYARGPVDADLLQGHDVQVKTGFTGLALARELHQYDLFLFPSLAEGFAHVVLEAMSCGLPVVTTPNTCGPDVLEDGTSGFLVPIRDVEALEARIAWGRANRADLAEVGRNAATRARELSWARFREGVRAACTRAGDA